jgi:phosphoglycerate kinase
LLLTKELTALELAIKNPKRPLVAILAGAKVSSKLPIIKFLIQWVDVLILGGGIANTFLAAEGYSVGSSLYEPDLIPKAKEILEIVANNKVKILLPIDVVVANELSENAKIRLSNIDDIQADEKIGDVGPQSLKQYEPFLNTAGTILWNGPIGIFELSPFSKGTKELAHAIANSNAFSIAGGGETLAAIEKYQVSEKLSYISTGGGAFLEYLEGKTLPAVAILEKRAKS